MAPKKSKQGKQKQEFFRKEYFSFEDASRMEKLYELEKEGEKKKKKKKEEVAFLNTNLFVVFSCASKVKSQ